MLAAQPTAPARSASDAVIACPGVRFLGTRCFLLLKQCRQAFDMLCAVEPGYLMAPHAIAPACSVIPHYMSTLLRPALQCLHAQHLFVPGSQLLPEVAPQHVNSPLSRSELACLMTGLAAKDHSHSVLR